MCIDSPESALLEMCIQSIMSHSPLHIYPFCVISHFLDKSSNQEDKKPVTVSSYGIARGAIAHEYALARVYGEGARGSYTLIVSIADVCCVTERF